MQRKICLEHLGNGHWTRTHTQSCVVYYRASSLVATAAAVINKADWWNSNMVIGSIAYWFESRFLHVTFFLLVFFSNRLCVALYLFIFCRRWRCVHILIGSRALFHGATSLSQHNDSSNADTKSFSNNTKKSWMRAICRYVFVRRRYVKTKSKFTGVFYSQQYDCGW